MHKLHVPTISASNIRSNNNLAIRVAQLIFLLTFVAVLYLLSRYDVVWAHPETVRRMGMIDKYSGSIPEALRQVFNWELWESAPRLSRPLSTLVDIGDTFFRFWLFKTVGPHPSISITWIATLIASPILLHRALALKDYSETTRWLGLSIYLATPGVLSLLTMSFRGGKAVACSLFLLLLCQTLDLRRHWSSVRFLLLMAALFVSLFVDEIAVFGAFVIILCFGAGDIRKSAIVAISTIACVSAFLLINRFAFPIIYGLAGHPITATYDLQVRFDEGLTHPSFYLRVIITSFTNAVIVFRELTSAELFYDRQGMITWMAPAVFLLLSTLQLIRTRKIDMAAALLLGVGIACHSLLMILTQHIYWGVYWYGAFLCLPWTLCVLGIFAQDKGYTAHVATAGLVAGSLILFIVTNYAYKNFEFYPYRAEHLATIFTNQTDRFALWGDGFRRFDLLGKTRQFLDIQKTGEARNIPLELIYLVHETRLCAKRTSGDYYHVIKHDDLFDAICYNDLLKRYPDELALEKRQTIEKIGIDRARTEHDQAAKEIGPDAAFVGFWDDGGICYVGYVDHKLYVVNSGGSRAAALLRDHHIFVTNWTTSATLSADSNSILWKNGSVWTRYNRR